MDFWHPMDTLRDRQKIRRTLGIGKSSMEGVELMKVNY